MTRFAHIAALALSFAAAGSAFAESPLAVPAQPAASIASRAQVQAEAGAVTVGEAQLNQSLEVIVAQSREAVRAETLAAIANGDVQAWSTDANTFGSPFPVIKRGVVEMHLAKAGR